MKTKQHKGRFLFINLIGNGRLGGTINLLGDLVMMIMMIMMKDERGNLGVSLVSYDFGMNESRHEMREQFGELM